MALGGPSYDLCWPNRRLLIEEGEIWKISAVFLAGYFCMNWSTASMRWDLDSLFGSSRCLLCMMELTLGIIAKVKGIDSAC